MDLISEGIEKVRAFELSGGIWADGRSVAAPRIALVKWLSELNDKFYQIYVNGRYGGVTSETSQRQMIVALPASLESAVRIDVFGVEAEIANTDFSDELDLSPVGSGRVKIVLLRNQNLPVGATAQIYFDNGTSEIDYDNPVNDEPILIWPVWQDKAGLGLSRFGVSDFGRDWSAGVGFGKGSFGQSWFGIDTDTIEWVSESLGGGVYKFVIKVTDEKGYQSSSSETGEITVIPSARPAEQVAISSFDKNTNQLVLSVS